MVLIGRFCSIICLYLESSLFDSSEYFPEMLQRIRFMQQIILFGAGHQPLPCYISVFSYHVFSLHLYGSGFLQAKGEKVSWGNWVERSCWQKNCKCKGDRWISYCCLVLEHPSRGYFHFTHCRRNKKSCCIIHRIIPCFAVYFWVKLWSNAPFVNLETFWLLHSQAHN